MRRARYNEHHEFYVDFSVQAHYDSGDQAASALTFIEGRRTEWTDHTKIQELGLRSAFETVKLEREGKTLLLRAKLTLHQTRYLLYFVSHTLKPRG